MSKKINIFDCSDGKPFDGKLLPSIQFSDECLVDLFYLSFAFKVDVNDLMADAIKLYLSSFKSINERILAAVEHVESKD